MRAVPDPLRLGEQAEAQAVQLEKGAEIPEGAGFRRSHNVLIHVDA